MGDLISNYSAPIEAVITAHKLGLTLPLLGVLMAVADQPGISINEVAERLALPQQTASRYVAILEGRYQQLGADSAFVATPLISPSEDDADSRRRSLVLSPAGHSALDKFLRQVSSWKTP